MRSMVPMSLLAAAVEVAPSALPSAPTFDWKQLAWAVASAVIAAGLEWLRRWLAKPSGATEHGDQYKDPPA